MFYEPLFALLIAVIFAMILYGIASPRRTTTDRGTAESDDAAVGSIFLFFFLILFLTTWAGGMWLQPVGPVIGEVAWVPFVAVGVLVALVLAAAATPYRTTRPPRRTTSEESTATAAAAVFGIFFWFLILALLFAIGVAYWT